MHNLTPIFHAIMGLKYEDILRPTNLSFRSLYSPLPDSGSIDEIIVAWSRYTVNTWCQNESSTGR
jgi:hypothetical protein